jgi:FHA domain-containing protein/zinc ribbon protein
MPHVYCPECGFQNPEAANFCSRCGAALTSGEAEGDSTMTLSPEEAAAGVLGEIGEAMPEGPALIVRSGGGRAGEHFTPTGERTTIGRSPDCDIFLDDVTVSRRHAVLIARGDEFFIEDQGSLNGTYVNRRRIESERLESGDELQVGKYRLTFLITT